MKYTKTLSFFLFFTTVLVAQKNEVYYQKIIDTTKNKQLKLAALDSLTYNFRNQKDLNKFADRLEQYVDLAIELGEYKNAIEFSIRGFYNINNKLNQKDRALKLIEKVEKYKDSISDSYLLGGIYLKKAAVFSSTKNHKKAVQYYTKAINYYSEKDSVYKADALYFRGNENFHKGQFFDALKDYQLASNYYEKLGDQQYHFYTLASIISVYGVNGFNKKTIEERKKLIQKKIEQKQTSSLHIDYYNQSLNYKKIDSIKQQEESLLKAYKLTTKLGKNRVKPVHMVILTSTLSSFYSSQNNLVKAKQFLDEAEKYHRKIDENTSYTAEFLRAKARYLFKQKKYNLAIENALNSYNISKKTGAVTSMMHSGELLSTIYTKIGNEQKALTFFKNYSNIKDSIFSVTKTNALSYYQTLYETEKKEKEINTQKASIKLLSKENEAKKRLLIYGGISLVLVFLIIYLLRNKQLSEKKRKIQEEYSQKLLLSQEEERKRISKDLHDSLGQSLLLIKNKISLKNDKKTETLVNNAIEEMRSISRVLHPFQLEEIGISKALENLIHQLDESYESTYIFGEIDEITTNLNQSQQVNVFRIVQECLSNIIKHAKAASAKVSLIEQEKTIIITIQDNGVGFDFSEKYNDFKSLGLKTIKERVRFLKGSIKIDSIKNTGTTFHIKFPTI